MPITVKIFKSLFSRLACRCIGAVGVGVVVAVVIAFRLISLSGTDTDITGGAVHAVRLPQNEEMLYKLSEEIREGTDVEGDVAALTAIAPAAGSPAIVETARAE